MCGEPWERLNRALEQQGDFASAHFQTAATATHLQGYSTAMIARDSGHARSFRDAAASDLNDFDVGPAFDQGFVRLARSRVQFLSHPHAHLQQSSRCCASGNQPQQNSNSS